MLPMGPDDDALAVDPSTRSFANEELSEVESSRIPNPLRDVILKGSLSLIVIPCESETDAPERASSRPSSALTLISDPLPLTAISLSMTDLFTDPVEMATPSPMSIPPREARITSGALMPIPSAIVIEEAVTVRKERPPATSDLAPPKRTLPKVQGPVEALTSRFGLIHTLPGMEAEFPPILRAASFTLTSTRAPNPPDEASPATRPARESLDPD